jgi:hypothetical protein
MWLTISGISKDGHEVTHVVPDEDLYEHTLSPFCWCSPSLDMEHMIATHNSADKREEFETGKRKPS